MASNDGGGDGFAKPAALPPRASNPVLPAGMTPKLATESKLSQDDFRRLMMTPRETPGDGSSSGSIGATPRRAYEQRPGGDDGRGHGERRRPDGGSKKDADDGGGKSKYRDRAKERRMGLLGEYEESAQILNQLAQSADGDESGISYEKSKYLGGDVAHTHLVKGLDYALLEQVKKSEQTAPAEPAEPYDVQK